MGSKQDRLGGYGYEACRDEVSVNDDKTLNANDDFAPMEMAMAA